MTWRTLEATDYPALLAGLRKLLAHVLAQPEHYKFVGQPVTAEYAADLLIEGDCVALVVDETYFVFASIIRPWFSLEQVLKEWLIVKGVGAGEGTLDAVPAALEQYARSIGVEHVLGGDSSSVRLVEQAYLRAGFSQLTTALYKGVPKWDGSKKSPENSPAQT